MHHSRHPVGVMPHVLAGVTKHDGPWRDS